MEPKKTEEQIIEETVTEIAELMIQPIEYQINLAKEIIEKTESLKKSLENVIRDLKDSNY